MSGKSVTLLIAKILFWGSYCYGQVGIEQARTNTLKLIRVIRTEINNDPAMGRDADTVVDYLSKLINGVKTTQNVNEINSIYKYVQNFKILSRKYPESRSQITGYFKKDLKLKLNYFDSQL